MKQTTFMTNGNILEREITVERFSDMLLQIFYLRESGEDITIETNASLENNWTWTEMTVNRNIKRGLVVTKFNR